MIANADQAAKIYRILRPNSGASDSEINGTAGKRSFAEFINSAQAEVQMRDANLKDQADKLGSMSATINAQNATITELNKRLSDTTTTNAQKQKELDEALASIAKQNAKITTSHDEIAELQSKITQTENAPIVDQPNLFIRILAKFIKPKST